MRSAHGDRGLAAPSCILCSTVTVCSSGAASAKTTTSPRRSTQTPRAASRLGPSPEAEAFPRSHGTSPSSSVHMSREEGWWLPSIEPMPYSKTCFGDLGGNIGHADESLEGGRSASALGGCWSPFSHQQGSSPPIGNRAQPSSCGSSQDPWSGLVGGVQWQRSSPKTRRSPFEKGATFLTFASVDSAWTEMPSTCEPCNSSCDPLRGGDSRCESFQMLSFDGGCCCESSRCESSRMLSFDDDEPFINVSTAKGGKTIQVARPPVHACIAFTSDDFEGERQRSARNVPALLNPKTKRLFQDIQALGQFPRRVGPRAYARRH